MDHPPKRPEPESPDHSLEDLLSRVFAAWTRGNVRFLILRNYEFLPSWTSHDVDVMIDPRQFSAAEALMIAAAAETGYSLFNRVEFATTSYFFFHSSSLCQVQIDLFTDTNWHLFSLLDTDGVLNRRVARGSFAIPHPADEAIISLFSRLIYHGYIKDKYKEQIAAGFRAYPSLVRELLAVAIGKRLANQLAQSASDQQWERIEELVRKIRLQVVWRHVAIRPIETARLFAAGLLRVLRRIHRPGGIVVAILEPDGCGPNSLGKAVSAGLQTAFAPDKSRMVHRKPAVFFRRLDASVMDSPNPCRQPPRNAMFSLGCLFWHWIEFLIGSHVLFLATTFRNGMVLTDRYFYDLAVDPGRYRLRVSPRLVAFLFRLVKQPDLVFLVDAPPGVSSAGKPEASTAGTAQHPQAFRDLVSAAPEGHILDGTQSVEQLANRTRRIILEFLRHRITHGKTRTP